MAKKMGLPVLKFIAVTNANDIIPQYLKTGTYLPQPAKKTISNAMDVGDPSNWDRIMDLFGHSINRIKDVIISESYPDEITKQTIRDVFARCRYILDPHSAIGCRGLTDYLKTADIPCCGIALATAHPAKFRDIVEEVIKQKIEMPSSLKSCLAKKKKSILLTNEMESFKEFLLS